MFARQYVRIGVNGLFLSSLLLNITAYVFVISSSRLPLDAQGSSFPLVLGLACCIAWTASAAFSRIVMRGDPDEESRSFLWVGVIESVAILGLGVLRLQPILLVLAALMVGLLTISALADRIRAAVLNGVIGMGFALFLGMSGDVQYAQFAFLLDLLVVAATLVIGGMLSEWRKQQKMFDQARWAASEFAHANVRLQDSMTETQKWTREKERKRLAREIHDTVGYALTAVLVQLSAAKELLRVDPGIIAARLERLEELVRKTIQEVRAEVSRLRKAELDSENWRTKWLELCKIFSDFTSVRVHAAISEELEPVDDELGTVVYRIIQESLTNAYRHGKASYIDVAVGWRAKERTILLRISDNGLGATNISVGSGIKGIRERVAGLGGAVAWETLPRKGFDLGVTIPWGGPVS